MIGNGVDEAWSVPAYCWVSPRNVCLSVPQMPEASIFDQHSARLELLRVGKAPELELPGRDEGCGEHVGVHRRMVGGGRPECHDGTHATLGSG